MAKPVADPPAQIQADAAAAVGLLHTVVGLVEAVEHVFFVLVADANAIVEVVLDRDIEQDENDGKIKNVSARLVINTSKTRVSSRDIDMNENDIKLTLRTIPYRGLKDDSYWLDNGILING